MKISYLYAKLLNRLRGKAIINSSVHSSSVVYAGSLIVNSIIGKYSYCSYDCHIENAQIGSYCSISDHVYIGGAEHPMDWVSMSPVFQKVRHSGPTKRFVEFELPPVKRTKIGSDVWIGHGVSIKQGVSIGHGAVIGSNALVTKDVPPYAVVGGVPAKIIKYRFDEETIAALLKSKWWDLPDNEIKKQADKINKPKEFLTQITNL